MKVVRARARSGATTAQRSEAREPTHADLLRRVEALEARVQELSRESSRGFPPASPEGRLSPADPGFYLSMTVGSETLRTKFTSYLDLLPDQGPVLELGSGSGEFLDLCAERGVRAWGVDASAAAVTHSRRKGLEVTEGRVPDFLQALPDASCTGIFAFQLIEHLSLHDIYALIEECARLLVPTGILVLETINVECERAMSMSYWKDPSHRTVVHPELALFLAVRFGFTDARLRYAFSLNESSSEQWRVAGDYLAGEAPGEVRETFHDVALIARRSS